jgi:anti-sigma factor RsiW
VSTAVKPIDDAELNAYVDGQLASDRVAALEDALRREPELASRVSRLREINSALRDALDPILAEPIPERLLAAATAPAARPRRSLSGWAWAGRCAAC